jgi:hypothetical protein
MCAGTVKWRVVLHHPLAVSARYDSTYVSAATALVKSSPHLISVYTDRPKAKRAASKTLRVTTPHWMARSRQPYELIYRGRPSDQAMDVIIALKIPTECDRPRWRKIKRFIDRLTPRRLRRRSQLATAFIVINCVSSAVKILNIT